MQAMHRLSLNPVFKAFFLAVATFGIAGLDAFAKVDFNRDIRPILSDKCYACHGFDEQERKSGLRLDVRDAALEPAKSGYAAIVPGDLTESELVRRIVTEDADDLMPPAKTGKPLTADEIALLKQWIAEGAEYQAHWSFVAPTRPALPEVSQAGWPCNEIDRFILEFSAEEYLSAVDDTDAAASDAD